MRLDRKRTYGLMAERGMGPRKLWHEALQFKPGLTEATVWNAANEKREVELDTAQAIAQALGTTVDFLTGASDQAHVGEQIQVNSEWAALILRINGLTPDQRSKLAHIMAELIDISDISRIPGRIATTLNGALYVVSDVDADVEKLAAMFERMDPAVIRRFQKIIDDRAADLGASIDDCEMFPARPPRLFPDE